MFESGTTAFVVVIAVLLLAAMIMVRRRETVFRVPATVESIRAIVARVSQSAEQARLTEQAIFQCKLATDEACANIIEHAYGESGGEIEVILKVRDGLHIHLIDFGIGGCPDGLEVQSDLCVRLGKMSEGLVRGARGGRKEKSTFGGVQN